MQLSPPTEHVLNRLFYAYNTVRRRFDEHLNRGHRNALRTVSRFLGTEFCDYAEFFDGKLITGSVVPF